MRLLIAAGADVERADGTGRKPLAMAMGKNGRILDALLQAGVAPPDAHIDIRGAKAGALLRTRDGARKLLATLPGYTEAAEDGYWELLELLLRAGVEMSGPREQGRTALHVAALAGDGECVRILLEAGVALETGDEDGRITAMLLAGGASAGVGRGEGGKEGEDLPLHSALRAGHVELVRLLLEAGADPDLPGRDGLVPLCLCARVEMLELLLAAKVRLGVDDLVSTAVWRQGVYGERDVFLRLLPLVDALQVRSGGGETLLHGVSWADESDDAERMRAVLARGVRRRGQWTRRGRRRRTMRGRWAGGISLRSYRSNPQLRGFLVARLPGES